MVSDLLESVGSGGTVSLTPDFALRQCYPVRVTVDNGVRGGVGLNKT